MAELENELNQQELVKLNDQIINNADRVIKEMEIVVDGILHNIKNNNIEPIGITASIQICSCERKVKYMKPLIEQYRPEYYDRLLELEKHIELIIKDRLDRKVFKVHVLLKRTIPSLKTCTFYKEVSAQNIDIAIDKVRTMIKDFMMDDNIIIELKAEEE